MKRALATILALLASLALLGGSGAAMAQPAPAANAPRITGFDVEPAAQPVPGNELFFTLYASPGGTARVQIAGAGNLALDEVEPGVYEGSYTIRQRDRITATSTATVNLRVGNRVATALLDESLVAGAPAPRRAVPAVAAATIERFDVAPVSSLASGANLFFTIAGTPNGAASVRIAGLRGKLVLDEVRPGVYEGTYDIRERDRLDPQAVATATLAVGAQEATRVLGRPLVMASARPVAPIRVADTNSCFNCGVVEAINPVEVKGDGGYVGKIAGGVVGAIIGSQVGSGSGRTAAQIAGALGGVLAGNEIEKRTRTATHYEVVVRLANGGTQTISYEQQPPFAVGARVRVANGQLQSV